VTDISARHAQLMVTCSSDSLAVPFHFSLPWAKILDLLDCF